MVRPRFTPHSQKTRANQRVFHPVSGIQIPRIARPPRAPARFVVWQLWPCARIVGLLGFPGDDPPFDIDLPRTRTGTIGAMRGADDLVVLPSFAITVLPTPVLPCDDAIPIRKFVDDLAEESETVEEMAHAFPPPLSNGQAGMHGCVAKLCAATIGKRCPRGRALRWFSVARGA